MKKTLFSACAFILMAGVLTAQNQRTCGTMEYLAVQKASDAGLEQRMESIEREVQQWITDNPGQRVSAVITIPVVFHIVYNTSAQNISDARINAQLDVLNKDFARMNADAGNTPSVFQGLAANTMIQFCLAKRDPNGNATTGIVRKSTTTTSFSTNNNIKFSSSGGDNAWTASSYLNIWTGNLSGGLLGYAQFPGGSASTDGVVVLYSSVGGPSAPGTANPYHLGRTATHEVGHWVNLYHIWGDDGTSCSGSDQVSDTPNQADENYGCPSFPTISCSNGPNGEMYMNYMDYTDDACMNMFTAGQASRMNATLNGTRLSLQSSQGCVPPAGGGCNVPSGLNATSVTASSATLNWSAVTGANSYNIQYRKTGTGTWTSTTSTTTSKAISGLTASSQYEFQVQTVCTGSSSAFSASSNFTTSAGACSDNYEPNNTRTAAPTIATNVDIVGLISPSGDNDYFKFTTTSPNTNVKVTLTNVPFDYDLKLYNSAGTLLATSQNGGTTSETVKRNTSTAATYYARAYGYAGANSATQCYTLRVSTSSTPFRTTSSFDDESDQADILTMYPNPAKDKLNLQFNSSTEGGVNLNVIDMIGRTVLNSFRIGNKGMNNFELNTSDLNKGIYFVEVNNGVDREIKKLILNK